jgi:hypothetical protein
MPADSKREIPVLFYNAVMSSAAFQLLESRKYSRDAGAEPEDGMIPAAMCRRYGFRGPHATPTACTDALRCRVAVLEFKAKRPSGTPEAQGGHKAGGTDRGVRE